MPDRPATSEGFAPLLLSVLCICGVVGFSRALAASKVGTLAAGGLTGLGFFLAIIGIGSVEQGAYFYHQIRLELNTAPPR